MNTPDQPPGFYQIQTGTGWARMLDRFAAWCAPRAGWRILDAGSGPGYLADRLARSGGQAAAVDRDWRAFHPQRLHEAAAAADVFRLPFPAGCFDLIAASNLVFLLPDPLPALLELRRCLAERGRLVLLNPSEHMSASTAQQLADSYRLTGTDRSSLLHYARRAEAGARWSAPQLARLLNAAGFSLVETRLQMGPGLVRFARARRKKLNGKVY